MTLDEMKDKFIAEVNASHISYGHDSYHAYSYINHPIMGQAQQMGWSDYDEYRFEIFADDWMQDNKEDFPCEPMCDCNEHTMINLLSKLVE